MINGNADIIYAIIEFKIIWFKPNINEIKIIFLDIGKILFLPF